MSMLIIGGNKMTTKTMNSRKGASGVVLPFRKKKKQEEEHVTFVEAIQMVLEVAELAREDAKQGSILKSQRLGMAIRYLNNFIGGQ